MKRITIDIEMKPEPGANTSSPGGHKYVPVLTIDSRDVSNTFELLGMLRIAAAKIEATILHNQ